ncbi:C6 zinc finger domain protein [Fusarium subglutinans]|uniref:C6 zinc finger domain protein n=1 Tax=Gibberella subglutinans TaxID=42677 RepID=A0A8H5L2T3_GIBSU|nr:C6 zinc finger domain protein [Fusarium subglutinans]KAF5584352.1 C6 zinc finger domain protein [Fusarium subglutinans]
MVGVPTSKGCRLCIQRSVKCDEERPSCAQCRRGGRTCPGYVREMKFVDEGPKIRRTRGKSHAPTTKPTSEKASKGLSRHNRDLLRHRETSPDIRLGQPSSFKAERDQILSSFVSAMFPLASATAQISFLGSWLWHIPPRLGSSIVLDHAALSVAWSYFAKLYGDPIALRNAETSYLCAVRSLALALDDAKDQLSANVLCATVLLGHFEISEALTSGQPCILESESWQNIPDGLIEFPLLPASPDMYHRIFGYFALIPGLQSRMSLCNRDASDETLNSLLSTAQQLRQDMRQWYRDYATRDSNLREPQAISPVSDGYPFPSNYKYHDVMSATIIVAYCAYLIILNRSVALLDVSDGEASDTQGLAAAICMSVDYCLHTGYCGTQTMKLALPIAHSVLPRHYHQWTKKWMDKFDAIMEATMIQPLFS